MEAVPMELRPKPFEVVHLPKDATKEQYDELAEWVLAQDGSSVRRPAILMQGGFSFSVIGKPQYLPAGRDQYDIIVLPGEYLVWRPDGAWEVWNEENLNEQFRTVPITPTLKEGFSFFEQ